MDDAGQAKGHIGCRCGHQRSITPRAGQNGALSNENMMLNEGGVSVLFSSVSFGCGVYDRGLCVHGQGPLYSVFGANENVWF